MKLYNYTSTSDNFWKGRIDDISDRDAFRMHQVIELIDLNNLNTIHVNPKNLNICILGFKSDAGVKRNLGRSGAELGPEYIRKEFANLPVSFSESTVIYDAGDIICVDDKLEEAQDQLRLAVKIILDNGFLPIVLGGGHALSLGHYLGISDHIANNKSIGIINFDAHWDLRPYTDKGSSGTMFSQIADYCSENDKKFAYLCLGIQVSGNTKSLFNRAKELGADHVLAKDFIEKNFQSIDEKIDSFISENDHIYLTLCSDVINSAFAPGVSALQPFGMNPEHVLTYIKKIIQSKKVIGFDIAEVSPRFDHDNHTAKLAAIIIYGLINALSV